MTSLLSVFGEDEEAILLINSFISQYDQQAIKVLDKPFTKDLTSSIQYEFHKWKNKIIPIHKKNYKIHYEAPSQAFGGQKVKMVFWPVQKTHLEVIEPIFLKIKETTSIPTLVFTHNVSLKSILNKSSLREYCLTASSQFHDPTFNNSLTKSILKEARKLTDLSLGYGKISFSKVLWYAWKDWYWYYVYTKKIYYQLVDRFSPDLIFVGNDLTLVGQIICHLARRDQIKVASIMHGAIKNELWKYGAADYFYLFGKNDLELMVNRGRAESGLFVSGSPKIEQKLGEINEKLIPYSNYVLVALSGPGHSITKEHHIDVLNSIKEAIKVFKTKLFIIKLHRKDSIDYYKEIKELVNVEIIEQGNELNKYDIYHWLKNSVGIVTGASMVAIESMVMDRPVITIDLKNHLKEVPFIKADATLHAQSTTDLIKNLKHIFQKDDKYQLHLEKIKKYSSGAFAIVEGGSSQFIANHLVRLLYDK